MSKHERTEQSPASLEEMEVLVKSAFIVIDFVTKFSKTFGFIPPKIMTDEISAQASHFTKQGVKVRLK